MRLTRASKAFKMAAKSLAGTQGGTAVGEETTVFVTRRSAGSSEIMVELDPHVKRATFYKEESAD